MRFVVLIRSSKPYTCSVPHEYTILSRLIIGSLIYGLTVLIVFNKLLYNSTSSVLVYICTEQSTERGSISKKKKFGKVTNLLWLTLSSYPNLSLENWMLGKIKQMKRENLRLQICRIEEPALRQKTPSDSYTLATPYVCHLNPPSPSLRQNP
jgi:hypothetical protein